MSIINAFIQPNVALVGVDTDAVLENGKRVECSKLHTLPHIDAVIAFRGYVCSVMYTLPGIIGFSGTFDELAEAMPDILNKAQQAAEMTYLMSGTKEPKDFGDVQAVLVGYSPKAGRMEGHIFESKTGSLSFDHASSLDNIIAPGLDDLAGIEADRKGMETLAKGQYEWMRKAHPEKSSGGRFFIAEIKKGGISIEEAFTFSDRE